MEKIYMIPVNDAFALSDGCPFCRLYETLEKNELDIMLGAAMMEPAIRIETNKKGFCAHHLTEMFGMKNRLSLALILESHLTETREALENPGLFKDKLKSADGFVNEHDKDCYICSRIDNNFGKMVETAVLMWESEEDFREKFARQPFFCMHHYGVMLEKAGLFLNKRAKSDFYEAASGIQHAYLKSLNEDISWFCKKFDYRYENEPWGNAKDAVERALKVLWHKGK